MINVAVKATRNSDTPSDQFEISIMDQNGTLLQACRFAFPSRPVPLSGQVEHNYISMNMTNFNRLGWNPVIEK